MKTSNHLLHKSWEDCSPEQEMEGGQVKADSFLALMLVNQQLIQIILVLQRSLSQNGFLKKYEGIKSNIKETTEGYVA